MFIILHKARNGAPILFNTDNIVSCALVPQETRAAMVKHGNKWDIDLIGCDVVDMTRTEHYDPDGHISWFRGILVRETIEDVQRIIDKGT